MKIAEYIDSTNVKPNAKKEDIIKLCRDAVKYKFRGVCISPTWVKLAKQILRKENIKVITVIGFPFGYSLTKEEETRKAVNDGVDEIDMVMNISAFKSKKYKFVEEDIKRVVKVAEGRNVKVIIECCYLNKEEKIKACKIAKRAGAKFVKTSTGYGKWGARLSDVRLMRKAFGEGVKAAGGIRTYEQALKFLKAGASVIGTSTAVKIVRKID